MPGGHPADVSGMAWNPFAPAAAILATLPLLLAPGAASAIPIEDFNDDGSGTRYTVVGGGGGGQAFWGLQSIGTSFGFAGQEGADFFAGRDLNEPFSGGANPLSVSLPLSGGLPLAAASSYDLHLLLAANDASVWDAGQDYLRIIVIDTDTTVETTLDTFLPNGSGQLESSTWAGVVLGTTFQDLSYALPGGITNVGFRIEAFSTGNAEYLGFDLLRIVPEPAVGLQLWLGLALAAFGGRRRATRSTQERNTVPISG